MINLKTLSPLTKVWILKSEDKPSHEIRSQRFSVYKRRRKTVGRSSLQLHKFTEEGFTSQLNQLR